jgi:hypothetical protein
MKKLTAALLCLVLLAAGAPADITALFPKMDGWHPEGDPQVYTADNLFEYIDGAADLYLTYDFKELGTLTYYDDQGRGLTIDIYQQGDDANAFGIYSQERPTPMDEVEIGAQGYYDLGILNFCQGPYYVKLSGFDLGDFDEDMLTAVGKIVSAKIGGGKELPKALACFPKDALISNSQRYIAKDVFGHGFLHSAFVAQYRSDRNSSTRAFIIEADDEADATGMLSAYLDFVKEKGGTVTDNDGVYRFQDPAARSAGEISLKKSGDYIWGISTPIETTASAFIAGVQQNLEAEGLLK